MIARPMSGSAIFTPVRDRRSGRDHAEGHEPVDAGVVTVGDERRAVEPFPGAEADPRGELVAEESDQAGHGERDEVVEMAGMDQAFHGFVRGDRTLAKMVSTTAYPAHRSPRSLRARKAIAERDRGERVAAVVDQVGEQRDRAGQREDDRL